MFYLVFDCYFVLREPFWKVRVVFLFWLFKEKIENRGLLGALAGFLLKESVFFLNIEVQNPTSEVPLLLVDVDDPVGILDLFIRFLDAGILTLIELVLHIFDLSSGGSTRIFRFLTVALQP